METNQPIVDYNKPIVIRSMTSKELCEAYKMSSKTLRKRLNHAGLHFTDRVLLPKEVLEVIAKLGPWNIPYSESEE